MPNKYIYLKRTCMYRQAEMPLVLTSHNVTEKNTIYIRFPFCVNLGFASDSPRLESRADENSNPGGFRKQLLDSV